MDSYEIYARKRVAPVREKQSCQFECHEYTWSEQGVSGYPVGWRIKASSRSDDRDLLGRIEKAAACASVDSQGRIAVEELMYDRSLGFIKLVSEPAQPGKDHRKNVRVRLYHSKDRQAEPQNYLAPHGQWPQDAGTSLSGITIDPISLSRSEILEKYHLQGASLVSFIDQVFSCIGRKRAVCFGVTDWEERHFAMHAAEVMLAVHLLLPQNARKYAGYLSFSRRSRENVPFYFRSMQGKERENREVFLLSSSQAGLGHDSTMESMSFEDPWQYMCFHLSRLLGSREGEDYDDFLSRLNEQMTEERVEASSDFVLTIPWIFYRYLRERGGAAMADRLLIRSVPQLCYWKAGGLMDDTLLDFVMKEVRELDLSETELRIYLKDLIGGITSRTRQDMIPEIARVLELMEKMDPEACRKERNLLKEEHREIAGELAMMETRKKVPLPYENPWFNMLGSLPMESALTGGDTSPGENPVKRKQIRDPAEAVLEEVKEYRPGKEPAEAKEDRPGKEPAEAKEDRPGREPAEAKEDRPGREPAEAKEDRPEREPAEMADRMRNDEKPRPDSDRDPGSIIDENKNRNCSGKPESSLPAETRSLSQEEGLEDYFSFLINSMPRGFLTGCMFFLSIYSIKIGHGKIALGMAGIWMMVMLNDQRVILEKRLPYPLWMILGLSLVEGLLISTTAWLLPSKKVRLLFFLIIGIITLLSQLITILRIVRKDR